jgi:hypothetical protein
MDNNALSHEQLTEEHKSNYRRMKKVVKEFNIKRNLQGLKKQQRRH